MIRVLLLAPALDDTSPGQRFRIEQWSRHLQDKGFKFTYVPFVDSELQQILYQPGQIAKKVSLMLKAFARRLRLVRDLSSYDLVYLFREAALIGPAVIERRIAAQNVPMLFDFDDAIWVPYVSPANRYLSYLKFFSKTETICRLSSHVMVGNPYLAAYARRYNSNVTIIPTTIDTQAYQVRPYVETQIAKKVTVGWTGSYSTIQHLDTLRPTLTELARHSLFRLSVIGTSKYCLEGVDTTATPWRPETEVKDLQEFDLGIMPLPDNNWSRGKCGLKLLQCMGVGVPTVGSAVGVNSDIIENGVNSFVASTNKEWVERLTLLLNDQKLRRSMGLLGRKTVQEHYSADVWAPRVAQLFKTIGRSS